MDHTMRMFAGGGTVTAYCTACGWTMTATRSESDSFPTADWQAHLEDVKQAFLQELGESMRTFRDEVDKIHPPKQRRRFP